MDKLDLTKVDKVYFTAKKEPHVVSIGPAQYLSICGKGDPSGKDFTDHIGALYPVAYAIKFAFKEKKKDFVVSKLEGLWWYDEKKFPNKKMDSAVADVPRSEWQYRLLIRMPAFVTEKDVETASKKVADQKQLELAKSIGFFEMTEGKCIQMMHIGPFSTEPDSLKRLMDFSEQNSFERNGLHHEIYLSDFRRVEPSKLKTILREPVK